MPAPIAPAVEPDASPIYEAEEAELRPYDDVHSSDGNAKLGTGVDGGVAGEAAKMITAQRTLSTETSRELHRIIAGGHVAYGAPGELWACGARERHVE
jgi:hypothetical protein